MKDKQELYIDANISMRKALSATSELLTVASPIMLSLHCWPCIPAPESALSLLADIVYINIYTYVHTYMGLRAQKLK